MGLYDFVQGPTNWTSGPIAKQEPTGYPIRFGDLNLSGTFRVQRNSAGPVVYAECAITCRTVPIGHIVAQDDIIDLPGGRRYRPVPDTRRAQVRYTNWTFEFLVDGHTDAVMAYQNELDARVGYVQDMIWSGARSLLDLQYSHFYQKRCRAYFAGITGTQERTLVNSLPIAGPTQTPKTHSLITLLFRQMSDFAVIS